LRTSFEGAVYDWREAMGNKSRWQILMLGAFAGATLVPGCAWAQDAQTEQLQRQTEQLQRQIDQMQRQLQSLQKQVVDSKRASQQTPQPAPADGAYAAEGPKLPLKAKAPPPPAVKLTWTTATSFCAPRATISTPCGNSSGGSQ
jgi:outer membrane murein-binding lipoprotein Lpp